MRTEKNIPLASLTTIQLGGNAAEFIRAIEVADVEEAIMYARTEKKRLIVLGGGSNVVFPDDVIKAVVLQIMLTGVSYKNDGEDVLVTAAAGENWDALVAVTIKKNLAGIEALSGIPGNVGATPIQNVGAYGQEVADVIEAVDAIDRTTGKVVHFTNPECDFGYRTSRFKKADRDKYIITSVTYRLRQQGTPNIVYPQLADQLRDIAVPTLVDVRDAVIALRRSKSMVIDVSDPNTISCGSFFTNPMLTQDEFVTLKNRASGQGIDADKIPHFSTEMSIKVPAAWFIEHAGFAKGERRNGVGISEKHALALVNRGGSTKELCAFADEIIEKVYARFGITLTPEPTIIE